MRRALAFVAFLALLPLAEGAPNVPTPHVGYLYPAGGKAGTTVKVTVGGQLLRGARGVHVSGDGVTGTIVRYLGNQARLNNEERTALRRELTRVRRERMAELQGRDRGRRGRRAAREAKGDADADAEEPKLPEHPLLENLDDLSLRELRKVAEYFYDPNLLQQLSPQIAEKAEIEIVIDADAAPGDREIRILTPLGLSNPMVFRVGDAEEVMENEVNDFEPMELPKIGSPFVLNGQVDRRDLDRFRFRAKRGQEIEIRCAARRLVPYLADAVPGWFQAVLEVRDAEGAEVAFADDDGFDPDPVLRFRAPADGEYDLLVRDAIYRGREDFVYRLEFGEAPRSPATGLPPVNEVWPALAEVEPNDFSGSAQGVTLPVVVSGRSDGPDDSDRYRFEGKKGQELVVEVLARRLGSPMDSVIELRDAKGEVVAWNDDREDRRIGLKTHAADSALRATLPADGAYDVVVRDATRHGGEEYGYRLRIGPPRPDFELYTTPSAWNLPAGAVYPVTIHVVRKDGFEGAIDLTLVGAPEGVRLDGGRIPPGVEKIQVTLAAYRARPGPPVVVRLEGRAKIAGEEVVRTATPAEDMMQAFLNRHLVPARELLLAIPRRGGGMSPMERRGGPAALSARGTARIKIHGGRIPQGRKVEFELSDPPPGITLRGVTPADDGILLVVDLDPKQVKKGDAGNLIVEVYVEVPPDRARGRRNATRYFAGTLPAIPYEVVWD